VPPTRAQVQSIESVQKDVFVFVPSANCCAPPGSIVTENASVPFFTNLNRLPAVAALQVGSPNVTFAPIVPIRTSFTSVVIVEDVVTYVCGFPQLGSHVVPVHCKTCEVAADCWAIFNGAPPEPSPSKVASVVTVPPPPACRKCQRVARQSSRYPRTLADMYAVACAAI
jgi:hypothetical protein